MILRLARISRSTSRPARSVTVDKPEHNKQHTRTTFLGAPLECILSRVL